MPDPVLFTQAFLSSAFASAVIVLAFVFFAAALRKEWQKLEPSPAVPLIALAAGMLAGYWTLQYTWRFPPANALDRLLEIVLPVTLMIELAACWPSFPWKLLLILRAIPGMGCGVVLMHNSVYLTPSEGPLPSSTIMILLVPSMMLVTVWIMILRISSEQSSPWIAVSLAMCIQAGSIAIMLAGYIKGGAAGIPAAASILATTITLGCLRKVRNLQGIVGVSLVFLFSLLFTGVFFGALSRSHAVIIFCSPLLCGCPELLRQQHWPAWKIGCLRLVFVATPLAVVLLFAWQKFNERMAPLLASAELHACIVEPVANKRDGTYTGNQFR